MAQKIIGRQQEINELKQMVTSGRPELVVVQGRRRVGKTFLVREFFDGKFAFYHTGLSPVHDGTEPGGKRQRQLEAFYLSLGRYGYVGPMPQDWLQAFEVLIGLLNDHDDGSRQVVFIDELPWMDTARSGFIAALEHFWNGWGAGRSNLMVILCGSATSWMADNIINSRGGLFNRTTREIRLAPFTLGECEQFYAHHGIVMDRYDQLQCYMVMGGIPYYLSLLQPQYSLAQNIDRLFYTPHATLRQEWDRLFKSLFVNADDMVRIATMLATSHTGFTRKEIAARTGLPYGGGLTKSLQVLQASDFVTSTIPYGGSLRDVRYRLVDNYTVFVLRMVLALKSTNARYWSDNLHSPSLNAWRGFAFERVCFQHLVQLKRALGIEGVHAECKSWASRDSEPGAQIDMLIDRDDRVVNVCEMKFSADDFTVTSQYSRELQRKLDVFARETRSRKSLHLTLVTTYGLNPGPHSGHIQSLITMDSLFT